MMVLPLTSYEKNVGPFTRTGWAGTYVVYRRTQSGWRQKPPFNVATAYNMQESRLLKGEFTDADTWFWGEDSPPPHVARVMTALSNMAYQKWVGKLGEASSFGATLTAERRDTWGMLVKAVTTTLRAAHAVKQLRFHQAASILGLPYRERRRLVRVGHRTELRFDRRQGRKRLMRVAVYQKKTMMSFGTGRDYVKTLANGWLLWSYGVKPLAQDCYNAIDVLTRDEPSLRIRGSLVKDSLAFFQSPFDHISLNVGMVCMADVKVINHDLYLASKMGLTNPLQWALEAIPFSFVLDWFSNLSQVVASMNELGGLRLENAVTTRREKRLWRRDFGYPYPAVVEQTLQSRILGIKPPVFQFAWERFSWQRGLNAISLLVGFLKGSAHR